MGRRSFKNIKNLRDLIGERSHLSWLYVNRLAAKKEYESLKEVYSLNLNTPKPIGYNRHMIVMEYLRGKELIYYKSIDDPEYIFDHIIDQVRIIFQEAGLVHGDLGEFNIVVDEQGNILIIDWLQSVKSDHPNSRYLLRRDIQNICDYFKNKFHIESNVDDIINSFLVR